MPILGELNQQTLITNNFARVVTGTYTGDGAAGGQSITGVGFQPKFIMITRHDDTVSFGTFMKDDQMGTRAVVWQMDGAAAGHRYSNDVIISLDADGFTIGNTLSINNNLSIYSYVVFG